MMTAESPEDMYSRVSMMVIDDGSTWDLSPKDKAALRHVLGLVNALADTCAAASGKPIPEVIRQHSVLVTEIQR